MNQEEIVARIQSNPKFAEMISTRNSYGWIMTVLMMFAYYGYILLIAFNKEMLGQKLAAGGTTSLGVPIGLGVILFTIVLTWIYVRRANSEFDALKDNLIAEATKK